ncbi:uncharacterized protein LOC105775173 [Gossypium raimondii]|uniref:uncharacterized protein LOC105775173 n=1 Tax=Gossypium raimondii TaxID=29730 RepID=UPI00063AB23F|nr:uncharacterized protein LOC105775173 [Gossypium raimondii]
MEQPPGFTVRGNEEKVYRLRKALYRLKQAPRAYDNSVKKFKLQMEKVFEMSNLEKKRYFLGMEMLQVQEGIFINQQSFALKILKRFCMKRCKTANRVLRYIKGSANIGEWFEKEQIVAQSSVEAEYVAAAATINQVIWLRKLLGDLNIVQTEATNIFSEDQLADILSKPLGRARFERLRKEIGVRSRMAKEECCEMANHATTHTNGKQSKCELLGG